MIPIIWSRNSELDPDQIFEKISQDSPVYATRFIAEISKSVEKLQLFPESGKVVSEYGIQHIREISHKRYRIVYSVLDNRIVILTVFNGYKPLKEL
jgi:plasmid stabilization system protein ParE